MKLPEFPPYPTEIIAFILMHAILGDGDSYQRTCEVQPSVLDQGHRSLGVWQFVFRRPALMSKITIIDNDMLIIS